MSNQKPKWVKQLQNLEEGGIKLVLSNKADYDPYMLELMKQTDGTLPCMRKQRSQCVFLYDTLELISLRTYLSCYTFDEKEVCRFLFCLFQTLMKLTEQLPVYVSLDSVYVDHQEQKCYCLVLPIHERVLTYEWSCFLKEIMQALHLISGDALLGILYRFSNRTDWEAKEVVELLDFAMKQQRLVSKLQRWGYAIMHQEWRRQREQRIAQALSSIRLQHHERSRMTAKGKLQRTKSDTVALFPKSGKARLVWEDGGQTPLSELTLLGRGEDCDIVLQDPTVSTHHAQIMQGLHGKVIIDLSSSNGTSVNGTALIPQQETPLHHRDQIQLANITMSYEEE